MNLRQLISFFSAILMSLASANATVPSPLGKKDMAQDSALQVETAILLDEDGTPRCRMGKNPGESLAALETLRECNESDELYTRLILESEEISLGTVAPPSGPVGKVMLVTITSSFALGGIAGCLLKENSHKWFTVVAGMVLAGAMPTIFSSYFLGKGATLFLFGTTMGFGGANISLATVCNREFTRQF